jgi:hypothetical protein
MNNILTLASRLYQLADICKEAAELLEAVQHEIPIQSTAPLKLSDEPLYADDLIEWPMTEHLIIEPKFSTLFNDCLNTTVGNILELIPAQCSPIEFETTRTREILSLENHNGDFVRHIKPPDLNYELIIINYYLEFHKNPLEIMLSCQKMLTANGKIYLLSRPWTSCNGGYQSHYLNRAYLHLCSDLEHNCEVQTKLARPQAQMQEIIENAKLKIIAKLLHTQTPPDIITKNKEIMDKIIKRTWNAIRTKDAISIMSLETMEFVLAK